jgi:hypothetical protein
LTILTLVDHDGVWLQFGGERLAASPACLALVQAILGGDTYALEGLAARYAEPVAPLEALAERLERWQADSGPEPEARLEPRIARFREAKPVDLESDPMLQMEIPLPLIGATEGFLAWSPGQAAPVVLDLSSATP